MGLMHKQDDDSEPPSTCMARTWSFSMTSIRNEEAIPEVAREYTLQYWRRVTGTYCPELL